MKTLIIVTGVSGSGKTTYCNNMEKPCIRFDNIFDYETRTLDFEAVQKWANENKDSDILLIDGFVYGLDPKLEKIKELIGDIVDRYEVHYIYMDPKELHLSQVEKNKIEPKYREDLVRNESANREANLTNLNSFVLGTLQIGQRNVLNQIKFFCRKGNEYLPRGTDGSEAARYIEEELLWLVDKISGDPEYQTIELRNNRIRDGYSLSWQSWDHILETGIRFEGKSVCDIGCFNGYFSIKAYKAGAREVVGLDQNGAAIRLSRRIANLNHCWKSVFDLRTFGEPGFFDRDFDIVLALNMLHHIEMADPEKYRGCLDQIFEHCKEVVFEVNQNQIQTIENIAKKYGFGKKSQVNTHRVSKYGLRFDLYFVKG